MIRFWLAALMFGVAVAPAPAATPQVGEEFAIRMPLQDGTVLLPPGVWFVAAVHTSRAAELEGAEVASVILMQPHEGHVAGVILAQANIAPLKSRPSLSSECWSEQAYFTAVAADDESGGACAAVLAVAAQQGSGSEVWEQARAYAAAKGWRLPSNYMVAALRSADRRRLIDVRYALAMTQDMISRAGSCAWAVPSPGGTGPVRQAAQSLTNFSEAMLPVFEMAGHSRLPDLGGAPPLTAAEDAPHALLLRLKQARIDELMENGALSVEQAEALRRRAAAPSPTDPLVKDLLWRSSYKTLTYKAATYIDTSAIYYLFVPDLPLVLVSSAITNVLGMPIVYINDFVWSYVGMKASKSRQPFALASLGKTCAPQ